MHRDPAHAVEKSAEAHFSDRLITSKTRRVLVSLLAVSSNKVTISLKLGNLVKKRRKRCRKGLGKKRAKS